MHHLDYALLHLDGGRSPYMNRNLLSVECKHSKPTISYSCTAHFSTIIVPKGKKQARKCPFYRLLRAFENYSISSHDTLYWLYIVLSSLNIVVEFHSFYVILFFLKVFATKLQPTFIYLLSFLKVESSNLRYKCDSKLSISKQSFSLKRPVCRKSSFSSCPITFLPP